MADRHTPPSRKPLPPVAPVLWQALGAARDAALAAGATSEAAIESARQLALALFPALPRTHLREALDALAGTPAAPAGATRLRHGPGQPVTFRLTPRPDRRWHADWICSRYAGPCLVSAGDEDGARGLAARHFRVPEVQPFDGDPWRRRDLVTVEAGGRLPPLPYGMVVPMVGRLGG
jgi:hypothetical protein